MTQTLENSSTLSIYDRLHDILGKKECSERVREICQSLLAQYLKKKSLSPAQIGLIDRFEQQFSEENTKKKEEWISSWDSEKKNNFKIVMEYYKRLNAYWKDVINKYNADPNMIPNENLYQKLVLNKYSQKIIENAKIPPKYNPGDTVFCTESTYKKTFSIYTIIENDIGFEPKQGGRLYKLMLLNTRYANDADLYTVSYLTSQKNTKPGYMLTICEKDIRKMSALNQNKYNNEYSDYTG